MGKTTLAAPYREVPGANGNIMQPGRMAVPAFGLLHQLPDRILPDRGKRSGLCNVLYPRYKDTGRSTMVTGHLRFVGNGLDDLVCHLFAMIAVGAMFCEDEPVAHN